MSCTECDAGPSANTLDDFSTDIFDSITNFSDSASIHSLIESPPLFSRSVGELYQIEDELKKYNNQLQLSISRSNSVGKMDNQITSKCYETINQNFEQLSKTKITDLTNKNHKVNKKTNKNSGPTPLEVAAVTGAEVAIIDQLPSQKIMKFLQTPHDHTPSMNTPILYL